MIRRRFVLAASLAFALAMTPASCARHSPPAAPASAPAAAPAPSPAPPPAATPTPATTLPDHLNDQEFWKLVTEFSEPGGTFRSDNLLSNEIWLQYVIPELLKAVKPGRVYMGVGPEQNFTYIAALKPAMVFIVDVRRGNLDLQLMYKSLFEMSSDRADFVSRLFSRKRPEGLTTASTAQEIFSAYENVPPDEALFASNLQGIMDRLQSTHGFELSAEDGPGIKYVYEYFETYGPMLTYWMSGGFGGRRNSPSYTDLMVAKDGSGEARSYLATEENFETLKSLEEKNLIVPLVGNFAGPKAIRAVGSYLRMRGATVSAFYLSNVEQYLNMDGLWMDFCLNVATLPLDESSRFIRAERNGQYGYGPGLLNTLGNMAAEVRQYCPGQM